MWGHSDFTMLVYIICCQYNWPVHTNMVLLNSTFISNKMRVSVNELITLPFIFSAHILELTCCFMSPAQQRGPWTLRWEKKGLLWFKRLGTAGDYKSRSSTFCICSVTFSYFKSLSSLHLAISSTRSHVLLTFLRTCSVVASRRVWDCSVWLLSYLDGCWSRQMEHNLFVFNTKHKALNPTSNTARVFPRPELCALDVQVSSHPLHRKRRLLACPCCKLENQWDLFFCLCLSSRLF